MAEELGDDSSVTENDINLLEYTVLNVTSDPNKLFIAYMFTIVTTIIFYIFIFIFWRGLRQRYEFGNHLNDMGYSSLHKHCLLVKGIPRHMAPSEARRHIKRILNMVEGMENQVWDVKVVEDFHEFFNLKQELQNLKRQIALSQKYERMLAQLEFFDQLSPDEKKQFLERLD